MDILGQPHSGSVRSVIDFVFNDKLNELRQYVSIVGDAFKSKLDELSAAARPKSFSGTREETFLRPLGREKSFGRMQR